ncbi:hypothetical protein EJB05_01803 [Eragrostis curvula]|uniref:Uncharacterized protein n=1 Tax=Eragrostis curvula TaxID=38414 RepID=A0A5J9WNV7_9POAL|nr:hypothetical protein EJB05_01803 [Eragrostis curvula]
MVSAGAAAQASNPQQLRPQREVLAKNSERLMSIGNSIRFLCRGTPPRPSAELVSLVYALARGVDFAVAAGDVPAIAGEVPGILRKVYELRKEPYIQSAVMVLIISCKAVLQNACSNKWFRPTDSADILRMANELSGGFCTSHGQAANYITVLEIISKIMPRYYPQLKFERLVTSIEAKAGYEALMADFFIERNLPLEEKIRLIVVQKENLDASSCIMNPPQVSFLVNGRGVEMRTNVSMEKGPQFPTDITKMLKYGANIIQAVGYFNANYVIAVAFIKSLKSFGAPPLDDYAEPVSVDSADSDVLEGPSRVSLRCPISLKRIKTPIKGHLCKHYQILQETEVDVLDVLLFADGSWKAAQTHNEKSDRDNVDAIAQTGATVQTDSSSSSRVIDLINGDDDDLAKNWTSASEDTKPVLSCQDLSVLDYLSVSGVVPRSGPAQENQMGSNNASTSQTLLVSSNSGLVSSSFGTLEPLLPQNVLCPVITDAVSPLGTSNSTSVLQHVSQVTHPEMVQPQVGPGASVPIHRNPRSQAVGVQELPVPPQNSGLSRGLQPSILNSATFVPSLAPIYQAHQVTNPSSVISPVNNGGVPSPRALSAAPIMHRQSSTQDTRYTSSHLPNRVAGQPAPHLMAARRSAQVPRQTGGANACGSMPILNEFMLSSQVNQTAQAAGGQTRAAAQVGPTLTDIQNHLFSGQQSQAMRPQIEPRAASPVVVPRVPSLLQSPNEATVAPSTPQARASDGLPELPVDENWRPTGQMRGSLTGNAYSHAIERYLGQTAQPQSQARPPSA